MPRFFRPLIACLIALALTVVSPAAAKVSRKKAIWGPVEVRGVSQFPIYAELGAGIFEMQLDWSAAAPRRPADPRNPHDAAYSWPAEIDRAVAKGSRYGITVSLLVSGTPAWANRGRDKRWAPDHPQDFANFVA